jgi:hypothetical protein
MGASLRLTPDHMDQLERHLADGDDEQLAFLLAHWQGDDAIAVDLRLISSGAFDVQTPWHLALSDQERATVIKWAHDHEASLVEAHVHRDGDPARFSPSDWMGLEAFVPHVWWRLRHRPYLALVFGETTFDGLAWRTDPESPEAFEGLVVEGRTDRCATGLSLPRTRWSR